PEDENEEDGFLDEDETLVDNGLMDLQAPLISLNVLTRTTNFKTMRVTVIEAYEDVFDVLIELPPRREHDHIIPLIKGAHPVNIRPYKHPPTQKDAIVGMVVELLEEGVIKKSNSPFSSPIVMVKKKDNSWRMCVDYR
ncbi:hypothetical protein Tco_1198004, partial [Tanacetum coccineum]